ncbi:MAG: hypothetical protein AAF320_06985, partial [Myxococcota bacterium]
MAVVVFVLGMEGVDGKTFAASIEKLQQRMAGATLSTVERQEVGQLSSEHVTTAVEVLLVEGIVVAKRQMTEVALQRHEVMIPVEHVQPLVHQQGVKRDGLFLQCLACVGVQVDAKRRGEEKIALLHRKFGDLTVFERDRRCCARAFSRTVFNARYLVFHHLLGL